MMMKSTAFSRRSIVRLLALQSLFIWVAGSGNCQTTLDQIPLRGFWIILKDIDQETFIAQLREIAAQMKFSWRMSRLTADGRTVAIRLLRDDLYALVGNGISNPTEYSMFLYNTDERNPVPADIVKVVGDDFSIKLNKINGIRVSDNPIVRY